MKTSNHKSRTRERMSVPAAPTSRSQRRAEQRKVARAERKARVAAKLKANPRLVRA